MEYKGFAMGKIALAKKMVERYPDIKKYMEDMCQDHPAFEHGKLIYKIDVDKLVNSERKELLAYIEKMEGIEDME